MSFLRLVRVLRPAARSFASSATAHSTRSRNHYRSVACIAALGVTGYFAIQPNVLHLDSLAVPLSSPEQPIIDPATSIAFPTSLRVPTSLGAPALTLLGVGVRTVSFLGIKVYSVGFYADLDNPNLKISASLSPEEKIKHIVENTACIIRIVPTRSTGFSHLRDAFVRALQTRLVAAVKDGQLTESAAQEESSPIRTLKGLFPNSSIEKHTPLDIYLCAPLQDKPRILTFRELGSVQSNWVATAFVLNYFEGAGPSPPLKSSVLEKLSSFSK